MSGPTVLTARSAPDFPIDMAILTPDRVAHLTAPEIAALPLGPSMRNAHVGDIFDVRGGPGQHIRIEGAAPSMHGLGAGTSSGELVIEGNVGDRVGAAMTGGTVRVIGNARHDAGLSMSGGTLVISGTAGDRLGAMNPGASKGMSGGEIIVEGSAGAEVAARARRGLVVVGGDVGSSAARSMIAGTLIVFGWAGNDTGHGNKRGSIVAVGGIRIPETYRYACTFEPAYIRLVLTYLKRVRGLQISSAVLNGRFRRYCGDAGIPGKGEILEWTAS